MWHLLPRFSIKTLFPTIALVLWLFNTLGELCRTRLKGRFEISQIDPIYSLIKPNTSELSEISEINESSETSEILTAIRLTLHSRSLVFCPGSFYYIRFRKQRFLDKFQSHPFLVAWWDNEEEGAESKDRESKSGEDEEKERKSSEQTVTFLIHAQNGLSTRLARSISPPELYLDGPYGRNLQLGRYKTVILVGDGIGIAGILPYAQHLAERKRLDTWVKEKFKKCQEALKSEQDQYFRAMSKARAGRYEADCAASYERMMEIREELRNLRKKNLHRDFTHKVDLFWVLDGNYQHQWVNDRLKKLQESDSARVRVCRNRICRLLTRRSYFNFGVITLRRD